MKLQKALIYCRVSSLRQVREGSGLDSQEHRCRQYANSYGYTVERVFPDDGISGSLFTRPAMKALISYLDEHWQEEYVIIFDDLKRFARDVDVHRGLKRELQGRGAKLCCLNYNFDDSPEGEFVETIFAAQNELERKQNRRQVCQKMKARLERGYWCFPPPSGYTFIKSREHGKILAPIRPITKILAEGLLAFSDNRLHSSVDLQRFFESQKLDKLTGKRLSFDYIRRILTEPLYAGIVEYEPWKITPRIGCHKAIITKDVYEKIQVKLRRPERLPRATDTLEFPLRRIVSCAVCGKPMTGSCSKGRSKYYPHYTCNNRDCITTPKNITASVLEQHYVELLESIQVEPEMLKLTSEIVRRIWQQRILNVNSNKTEVEKEIKELNRQIDEFVELVAKTRVESIRVRYEAKIEELDQKIQLLSHDQNTKKLPDFEEALARTLTFIGTTAECWKNADLDRKILLHNLIFTENPQYSSKTGFGTPNISVPFYIKEHVCSQIYCMVDLDQNFWNRFIETLLKWQDVL